MGGGEGGEEGRWELGGGGRRGDSGISCIVKATQCKGCRSLGALPTGNLPGGFSGMFPGVHDLKSAPTRQCVRRVCVGGGEGAGGGRGVGGEERGVSM